MMSREAIQAVPDIMEDWEAQLTALESRLRAWRERFDAEYARVIKERKLNGLFRKPTATELDAAGVEARRRAGEELLVELSAFFDRLCDHYPTVLPQERAKIRAEVGSNEQAFALFWNYVEQSAELVRKPEDGQRLMRALIAVVIDDLRTDVEQVNAVVGRILLGATEAGLDWREAFAKAAAVANPGMGGGGAHMRAYLNGFTSSNYFREVLEPKLRDARGMTQPALRR